MFRLTIGFILLLIYWTESKGQIINLSKNWKYIPIDEKLYQKVALNSSNLNENIKLLFEIQDKNKSSLIGAEAQALIAQKCLVLKLYFCSYNYSLKIINDFPGTMPSYLALETLKKLLETVNFIDLDVETILSKGGFTDAPESLIGILNFYLFRHNTKLGFKHWANANIKGIPRNDYWYQKYQFLVAIDLVRKKQPHEAKKILQSITKSIDNYPELLARVNHQIARINFELKDYDGAESIYSKLVTAPREYGRALIERAWIRYLKKDYAIALGMIHSLKIPSLSQSQHPDQYKLQILILRDLCYFSEIKNIADEFKSKYENALSLIESGDDLTKSVELLNIVFQKAQWLPWAELISQIRTEKIELLSKLGHNSIIESSLLPQYELTEERLKKQLQLSLKSSLETVAEELLEVREQINLLEYLAGLDRIRPKVFHKKVKAEEIEKYAITKIYWPQTTEFWRSEINNIKVLISDRCQGD